MVRSVIVAQSRFIPPEIIDLDLVGYPEFREAELMIDIK
jgi:hypothetical protein